MNNYVRSEHERNLTHALVALAGREQSYWDNAEFKHSVDILVRLLSIMVNGLGIQADAEHQDRQALIDHLMSAVTSYPPFPNLKGNND